ncbi:hypothetical protein CPB84DRAFT_1850332 [Gymnopilus junonius]|uniref:Uncharacterized protein n=1 Tax=Gymnopilus junonius TaxID=109634 RepID=A0A9P5NIJ3_GYMJU|nr:hypothetical protein CPB84DRAFT_1850332 [Gymnopilus junonius]
MPPNPLLHREEFNMEGHEGAVGSAEVEYANAKAVGASLLYKFRGGATGASHLHGRLTHNSTFNISFQALILIEDTAASLFCSFISASSITVVGPIDARKVSLAVYTLALGWPHPPNTVVLVTVGAGDVSNNVPGSRGITDEKVADGVEEAYDPEELRPPLAHAYASAVPP